jgi:hypothetical protein
LRKIVISGLVTVAAVLGSAVPAVTASAATAKTATAVTTTAWPAAAGLATPARPATNISADLGAMGDKISCASPTACLAVEGIGGDTGPEVATAEALHGTAWRSVAVKAPKGAQDTALTGVSCKAATYCLVLGAYEGKDYNYHPAAWTWNGTALTPLAAPPLPKALDLISLAAVSCVAVKSCVAFGTAGSPGLSTDGDTQLIWTWNGAKWALRTAALPGSAAGTEVTAAHCFSITSCIVAGATVTISTGDSTAMAVTWNGKEFMPQQMAQPKHVSFAPISGISCSSPAHCAAVGENLHLTTTTETLAGFVEIWNGKTWTVTNWAGPKGSTYAVLIGVSCTSPGSCMAAGVAGTDKSASAQALTWNGTHWWAVGVPSAGKGLASEFEDVSCPKAGDCVAIGQYGKFTASTAKPLAGFWNGKAWKLKAA